jgi:methionine--tRNA ligase beta chain
MSVAAVDSLTAAVAAMPIVSASAASTTSASSSSSSFLDIAWAPETPPGHTPYTWAGIGEESGTLAETAASSNDAAAAPAGASTDTKAAAKAAKAVKTAAKAEAAAALAAANDSRSAFSHLDIRVGKIVKVYPHPDADSLYVEEIDCGEEQPRTICSGLRQFYKEEQLLNLKLCVVANLKPAKLRGIESFGMVLCAVVFGDEVDGKRAKLQCELLAPPAGAEIGARVELEDESYADGALAPAVNMNSKKKSNLWSTAAADLAAVDGVATFKGRALVVGGEKVTAPTIQIGPIS